MNPIAINLADHIEKDVGVLAGQDEGKAIRDRYGLDHVDALPPKDAPDGLVTIAIPESVYSFNSSFFLGMLSKSVATLGAEEFRRRYRFTGPDAERTREKGIRISLLTSSPIRTLRNRGS